MRCRGSARISSSDFLSRSPVTSLSTASHFPARTFQKNSISRRLPLSSLAVFLLYCAEGLSPIEIARTCHCTKGLIFIRLRWLRAKLGRDPAELRQYSAQFESIEKSLSDPRARNIYRKGAIYGREDSAESEA